MVTGFLIVSSCAFLVVHGHWEPSVRICSLVLFIVGRLSACIGTLLDAHRLALVQLNRHLKLTAIVHLVAAERLIHEFKKDKDKKEAVKLLIPIIAKLIPSEQAGPVLSELEGNGFGNRTGRNGLGVQNASNIE
jgi:hypothetical protein